MIHLVRLAFLVAVLSITISFAFTEEVAQKGANYVTLYVLIPAGAAVLVVLLDMFWRRKRLQVLSGVFFGLLAGLLIALVLTFVVDLVGNIFFSPTVAADPGAAPIVPQPATQPMSREQEKDLADSMMSFRDVRDKWQRQHAEYLSYMSYVKTMQLAKFLLGVAAVFVCVSIVMQTKDDFRFVIPYVEFTKQTKGARAMLLDTSVIIDGRIADICETRVLDGQMIVPRFVLQELQAIADSEDKLKRNRGRRGLDVLNKLQKSTNADIRILDTAAPRAGEPQDVDARLVSLAKHMEGRVVTNDYNLNKVAQLRGVEVININDLANALKSIVLPGEALAVKVIKPGAELGQGVGYLEDGTMVVVEQGRDHLNKELTITVTSVLQTSAGRMIFGRLDGEKSYAVRDRRPSGPAGPGGAQPGPKKDT